MSDDETRLFGAQIDKDTHDILKSRLEYGEKSQLIRDLANSIAYGDGWDERTPIDIQIENVEQKLADARSRRRQATAAIEDYEDELARLREKRQNTRTREERLQASLIPIESDLRNGTNIYPGHGGVQSVAREFGLAEEAVREKLKARNPDVPDHAFLSQTSTPEPWEGVEKTEQNIPVEKREELYRCRDENLDQTIVLIWARRRGSLKSSPSPLLSTATHPPII